MALLREPNNKLLRIRTFESDKERVQGKVKVTKEDVPEAPELKSDAVPLDSRFEYTPESTQQNALPKESHAVKATPARPEALLGIPQSPQEKIAPAFRTISEELETIARPQKTSILADENVYDTSSHGGGTIIRDTKRKRFKLLPSIGIAVGAWYSSTKEALDKAMHPKHKVSKAEARAAIIQKAATASQLAPKDDFKTVAQRLKAIERKPQQSSLILKDKAELPPPSWTHVVEREETQSGALTENTDQISAQAEDTIIAPSLHEEMPPAQQDLQETSEAYAAPSQYSAPELEYETEAPQANTYEPEETEQESEDFEVPEGYEAVAIGTNEEPQYVEEPALSEVQDESEDADLVQNSLPSGYDNFVPPPEDEPMFASSARATGGIEMQNTGQYTQMMYAPARYETGSKLQTYVLISVVVLATLSGIATAVYLFQDDEPALHTQEPQAYVIPPLVKAQRQVSIPLSSNRTAFLETLAKTAREQSGVTQLYPTFIQGEASQAPASAEMILATLKLQAPGSFTRSIREMTFGSIDNVPFVLLKATSFESAFAGMLEWERYLSADLSPLFGEPVIQSFDPQSRTATGVRSAFYKDVVASNKNVRLLFDENGTERILYAFINESTVLITTNREALNSLLPYVE